MATRSFRRASASRPTPFQEVLESEVALFVPAPDLAEWALATFVASDGLLFNAEHEHLQEARLGCLWTSMEYFKQGNRIAGTAELAKPPQTLYGWQKARYAQQLREWFPDGADFILTFDAPLAVEADDASWCARVEHELYHCAWKEGCFREDGSPVWRIKGHDGEFFLGVTRRYGFGAAEGGVAELVRLARRAPTVAAADIADSCGVCLRAA